MRVTHAGMLAGGFVMWRKRRAAPDDAMAADADGAPAFASEPPTMPPMAMMPTALDAPPAAPPSKSRRGRARGAPRGPDPLLTWMASQLPATPQPTSPLLGRWAMDFSKLQGMRPIGEGSFGRVYAATYDGAPVAAKVLVDTAAWQGDGPDSTALSMQAHMSNPSLVAPVEVTLMASMDHPNIVKVRPWICMGARLRHGVHARSYPPPPPPHPPPTPRYKTPCAAVSGRLHHAALHHHRILRAGRPGRPPARRQAQPRAGRRAHLAAPHRHGEPMAPRVPVSEPAAAPTHALVRFGAESLTLLPPFWRTRNSSACRRLTRPKA
jgi:hypothetical protein